MGLVTRFSPSHIAQFCRDWTAMLGYRSADQNGGYRALASGPLVTLSDKDGPSTGSLQQPRWKALMIILIDLSQATSSDRLFEKATFMMRT
jgi:hypothetical protein